MCKCIFFYKHKEKWVRFERLLCGIENATDEKVESIKQFAKGFFVKESEKGMITDKQGREWLLQKLYDEGWRYLVMDVYRNVYLTNEIPRMQAYTNAWEVSSCESAIGASAFRNILPKLECNGLVSIAEELGIVDWSKVAVDTPVLVKGTEKSQWTKRYFAFFENDKVYTWDSGATSWSKEKNENVSWWNYAKLAEV